MKRKQNTCVRLLWIILSVLIAFASTSCSITDDSNSNNNFTDGDTTESTTETEADIIDKDEKGKEFLCIPTEWMCFDDVTRIFCDPTGMKYEITEQCEDNEYCRHGLCWVKKVETDGDAEESADSENPVETDGDNDSFDFDLTDSQDTSETEIIEYMDGDEPDGDEDSMENVEISDAFDEPELTEPEIPEKEEDIIDTFEEDSSSKFSVCNGKTEYSLESCLRGEIDNHDALSYSSARQVIYSKIDIVGGKVQCVYTAVWANVGSSGYPSSSEINCEHTWPQSQGAGSTPPKSDMHHLFPTEPSVNSSRGNLPFGIVTSVDKTYGDSKRGSNKYGTTVFEPRDPHKGDCARAKFYFAVRYNMSIPSQEEEALRIWHEQDPPSQKEFDRNDGIESYQDNRNPFIDRPEFVNKISDF